MELGRAYHSKIFKTLFGCDFKNTNNNLEFIGDDANSRSSLKPSTSRKSYGGIDSGQTDRPPPVHLFARLLLVSRPNHPPTRATTTLATYVMAQKTNTFMAEGQREMSTASPSSARSLYLRADGASCLKTYTGGPSLRLAASTPYAALERAGADGG